MVALLGTGFIHSLTGLHPSPSLLDVLPFFWRFVVFQLSGWCA
ncbi:hypothetical protein SynPROSU1_02076 [Synechococcus sp. PROS-U-1]|nr:hypothetical protein SynPROSU1_02076 [Synechococcus sp. PROS-U-1]